jgi:rubrerythrin
MMSAQRQTCLPIDEVLKTVTQVETEAHRFYDLATAITGDDEATRLFATLRSDMITGAESLKQICADFACGSAALEGASEDDLYFLSVLADTGFYSRSLTPEKLAEPGLPTAQLLGNAMQLERDLLLFYMKFHGVSCAQHRPVFSGLIARGQRHMAGLNNLQRRLKQR